MRCGGRFGKALLRDGLGQRHLTEGPRRNRARLGPAAADEARGQERAPGQPHREQQQAPRLARMRTLLSVRHDAWAHPRRRRRQDGFRGRRVTLRAHGSRLDRWPIARTCALRVADARRRARQNPRNRHGHATRAGLAHGGDDRGPAACCRTARRARRRLLPYALRSYPRRIRPHRRWSGLGHRRGRLRGGWPFRCLARREERLRVDVPVGIRGQPDPEVDVGLSAFDVAGRPDRPDDVALGDLRPRRHRDRSQVNERDGVSVGRAHGQAEALMWQLPDERHDPAGRGAHIGAGRSADVDATVLTARVRVAPVHERPEHRPVDGPRPGRGARGQDEKHE